MICYNIGSDFVAQVDGMPGISCNARPWLFQLTGVKKKLTLTSRGQSWHEGSDGCLNCGVLPLTPLVILQQSQ
jgi:hypothetical protein